jgi:hypothetical protein
MNFKFEAFFEGLSLHVTAHGPAAYPDHEKSAARRLFRHFLFPFHFHIVV